LRVCDFLTPIERFKARERLVDNRDTRSSSRPRPRAARRALTAPRAPSPSSAPSAQRKPDAEVARQLKNAARRAYHTRKRLARETAKVRAGQAKMAKPRYLTEQNPTQIIHPAPKVEFSRFDGNQPRSWILKCNSYFKLVPNIPDQQKVILASMHLEGKAALWYQNFSSQPLNLTWDQFIDVISARFEELRETKIISEFNKLRLKGSYEEYVEKFEELNACMQILGKYSEEYFIASFISWLAEELQAFIHIFEPSSLLQTIELGRQQLLTLEAITRKVRNQSRPPVSSYPQNQRKFENQNQKSTPAATPRTTTKLLSSSEMAERREKGLCYNCDEKFTFGHRCKNRINYMIMTEEEELAYLKVCEEESLSEVDPDMEEVQMSLNSLSGEDGVTTMRLFGQVGKHKLHILIDSGSTLSFIQEKTAHKLGCKLDKVKPLLVNVANGQRLVSNHVATEFTWDMQGNKFTYPLRVLKNEGCDLILGGDWLKSCTPIELDYEDMTFTVTLQGKKVRLQALTSSSECQFISGHSLYKLIHTELSSQIEELY
ncbi:Unknown protein, partial [Striga hermonthica]